MGISCDKINVKYILKKYLTSHETTHSIYIEFRLIILTVRSFEMENKSYENLIVEAESIGPVDEEIANKGSMVVSDKEIIIKPVNGGGAENDEYFSSKL
jgi:hypothetical protein